MTLASPLPVLAYSRRQINKLVRRTAQREGALPLDDGLPLALRLVAAVAIIFTLVSLTVRMADAQISSGGTADVSLSMSVISLTERDGLTNVAVTAALRQVASADTTINLALGDSPLLTPGVARGAASGTDFGAIFDHDSITIAAGSLTGTTTLAIDPIYDTRVEGDEAVVLTGTTAGGVVTPTDLIIEDGPYLSFPRHIYGHLSYPGRSITLTVDEPINKTNPDSVVYYGLTNIEPSHNPLGLTFDPSTRQLTGFAPAAEVPDAGLTTRYTITAVDTGGRRATTLVSVAVVKDLCGSTTASWFHATQEPPPGLIEDCNVLLAAKDSLNGTTGALNWTPSNSIERWDGLTEFHVDWRQIRRIEIHGHKLNGVIPPVLGHLAAPSSLDLVLGDDYRSSPEEMRNRLTGPIPPELGLPPNLKVLALSRNDLAGPIPRELANIDKLNSLYLHETGVQGPIPRELGNLPLRNLNISGNRGVTGHVPWQLGKNVSAGDDHPGLQVLNLSGNQLEGTIPWQLGRFSKIQHLALSDNRLVGRIPRQLGNLGRAEATLAHRVVALHLNKNQLTGPIPPQLGDVANLQVLSVSENRLTGPIPPQLGGLAKLRYLYLRDNRLTGSIPPELGDLDSLAEFHAYNNRLDGDIPPELGSISALRQVGFACNDLSGSVPASIASHTTLTDLQVQGNPRLDVSLPGLPGSRAGLTVVRDGPCPPQYAPAPATHRLDVTVSRSAQFPGRLHVSTRAMGQDWIDHDGLIDFSALSAVGRFQRSMPVPVRVQFADLEPLTLDVTVWRSVRFPDRHYVSTRPAGQGWTTHHTAIALSAPSVSGRLYRGDPVVIEVALQLVR
jgi:Leucine-rich repeat (LRR) protein